MLEIKHFDVLVVEKQLLSHNMMIIKDAIQICAIVVITIKFMIIIEPYYFLS
jgi:hypothetical protein